MSTSKTSIEWCDRTWNCVRGCSRVSEGCRNCYAERMAARFSKHIDEIPGPRIGQTSGPFHGFAEMTKSGPRWTGKVELIEKALRAPLSWRKPAKVFVNSMSDLFHESLPDEAIDQVFAVMALAPRHTFQVLTKRPARMLSYLRPTTALRARVLGRAWEMLGNTKWRLTKYRHDRVMDRPLPLPNVWLGVSCEDQKTADERIPLLLQTPAAVRFVSYEPALGPLDVQRLVTGTTTFHVCADVAGMLRNRSFHGLSDDSPLTPSAAKAELQGLLGRGVKLIPGSGCDDFDPEKGCRGHRNPRLDWVIVGGESGHGARPFDPAWMRAVVAQCRAGGVAAFCKQWGSNVFERVVMSDRGTVAGGVKGPRLDSSKGGDISEWGPGDWPRDFPRTA
jgi:protein gp37